MPAFQFDPFTTGTAETQRWRESLDTSPGSVTRSILSRGGYQGDPASMSSIAGLSGLLQLVNLLDAASSGTSLPDLLDTEAVNRYGGFVQDLMAPRGAENPDMIGNALSNMASMAGNRDSTSTQSAYLGKPNQVFNEYASLAGGKMGGYLASRLMSSDMMEALMSKYDLNVQNQGEGALDPIQLLIQLGFLKPGSGTQSTTTPASSTTPAPEMTPADAPPGTVASLDTSGGGGGGGGGGAGATCDGGVGAQLLREQEQRQNQFMRLQTQNQGQRQREQFQNQNNRERLQFQNQNQRQREQEQRQRQRTRQNSPGGFNSFNPFNMTGG